MDILLWRWSTAVQLTSVFMIAVFFATLSRSVHRPEVVWWTRAWIANLAAILFALLFWYLAPQTWLGIKIISAAYLGAKIAFVLLLIQGSGVIRLTRQQLMIAIAIYGVGGGLLTNSIPALGLLQHGTLGVLFIATAIAILRRPAPRSMWFAAGLIVRSVVALAEAFAYVVAGWNVMPSMRGLAASFVAASSSFDSGAEWFLALGCVLAISQRIQSELAESNRELVAAQEELRALADRDPLTSLANRRALPAVLRAVQPVGAIFLFFDLDGFKDINDTHGHGTGDECLRQFAAALQACFRPDDAIVRYGGDEFVVVAPGLDVASVEERVDKVRRRLREAVFSGPNIRFSVGMAEMKAGGRPEESLHAADEAMYESKAVTTLSTRRSAR